MDIEHKGRYAIRVFKPVYHEGVWIDETECDYFPNLTHDQLRDKAQQVQQQYPASKGFRVVEGYNTEEWA